VGHAAHIRKRREMYTGFDEATKGKRLMEDLVIDGSIILKWILHKHGLH
jgi:hypothetical protein